MYELTSTSYERHVVDDRKIEQEIYSCRYTGIFVDAKADRQDKSKTWVGEQQQGGGGRYVRLVVMGSWERAKNTGDKMQYSRTQFLHREGERTEKRLRMQP